MWYLENFSDEKLLDIVENYASYKYDVSVKYQAEALLKERGIKLPRKKETAHSGGTSENFAQHYLKQFKTRSIFTYALFFALVCVQFLVNSYTSLAIFGALLLVYIVMLFLCYASQKSFFRSIQAPQKAASPLLFILCGFPFFPIYSIYLASKMKL